MKITDELFERGKNQKEICSIINDDYVLIKKKMPCTDDDLKKYIDAINKAKESGINICAITDFRFIDGTTETFGTMDNKKSYTTGVFIENRAKGGNNPQHKAPVKDSDSLRDYINTCFLYIEDLEKRANADQSVFDKLVSDYVGINKLGITPDPKPTNFFFDEKEGYTIIDVIDVECKSNQFLLRYILTAVFGYGLPVSFNLNDTIRVLPESWYQRYMNAYEEVFRKVITSIKKLGLEDEYTKEDLEFSERNFAYDQKVLSDEELEEYINNFGKQR